MAIGLGALEDLIVQALAGLTMVVVGGVLYQSGRTGFRLLGGTFQSKEIAQGIVIGYILIAPHFATFLEGIWGRTVSSLDILQALGILLVMSRIVVNSIIDQWNFADQKSLIIYALGIGFVVLNQIIRMITTQI